MNLPRPPRVGTASRMRAGVVAVMALVPWWAVADEAPPVQSIQYTVKVCNGSTQLATYTLQNKLPSKEFVEVDFRFTP